MKKFFCFFFMSILSACILGQTPMRVKKVRCFDYRQDTCFSYVIYATRNDSSFVIISYARENFKRGREIKKENGTLSILKRYIPMKENI